MHFTQMTLGTAALVILLACAGYVVARGVARMIAGLLLLAASGWLAYQTWRHAPEIAVAYFGKPLPAVTLGLPAVVFGTSFWVLLRLGRLVLNPFGERTAPKPASFPRSIGSFVARVLFALVPAGLICAVAAGAIRFAGSAAEVDAFARKAQGRDQVGIAATLQGLKTEVEKSLPSAVLEFVSPASEPSRVAMAKAVIERMLRPDQPPQPVIDPSTGRPIPRAVPVDEPELRELARTGRFSDLLRHPLLAPSAEPPGP